MARTATSEEARDWIIAADIAHRISVLRGRWGSRPPHDVVWRITAGISAIRSGTHSLLVQAREELKNAPTHLSDFEKITEAMTGDGGDTG